MSIIVKPQCAVHEVLPRLLHNRHGLGLTHLFYDIEFAFCRDCQDGTRAVFLDKIVDGHVGAVRKVVGN